MNSVSRSFASHRPCRGARRRPFSARLIRSISATEKPVSRLLRADAALPRACRASQKAFFSSCDDGRAHNDRVARAPRGLAPPAPRASPRPAPARRDGVSPRRAVCRRGIARRGGARGRAGVRVPRVVRVSAGRDRPDARGGDSPDRRPRRRGVARGRRGGPGRQGLGGDAERRPGVAPKPSRVVGGGDFGKFGFEARVPRDADGALVGTIVERQAHTRRRVDGRFLRRG